MVERKRGDDWVSACRNGVVAGVRCAGRGQKTWRECGMDDIIGVISYPDSSGCIIPHEGKDIQGLCLECVDIQKNLGDKGSKSAKSG